MAKRRSYSEEDRLKAVTAFVLCGTIEGAARQVGIPASTIYNWRERNPSWWEKSTERAWELIDPEIQAKMLKVIQRGLDEAADRLDNGDERLMSNGEIRLVKPSVKDLNIASVHV